VCIPLYSAATGRAALLRRVRDSRNDRANAIFATERGSRLIPIRAGHCAGSSRHAAAVRLSGNVKQKSPFASPHPPYLISLSQVDDDNIKSLFIADATRRGACKVLPFRHTFSIRGGRVVPAAHN